MLAYQYKRFKQYVGCQSNKMAQTCSINLLPACAQNGLIYQKPVLVFYKFPGNGTFFGHYTYQV